MTRFAWIVTIATMLLVPLISFFYVYLRLAARAAQLGHLFTLPGILKAYLTSKGLDVSRRDQDKEEQKYLKRLRDDFKHIFKTEFKAEYGHLRYALAIIVGSAFSGLVVFFLATGPFGRFLSGSPDNLAPPPLQVALLGAFTWNLFLLLSSYEMLDLVPSTFYWMPFRYIVAIIAGLIGTYIFKEPGVAIIFALMATIIPYPRLLEFLRSRVPGMKEAHAAEPPLWKIQGMQEVTIDRLAALGIYTTQELAYSDPLMLLFRTNFQPKVVIDWIDQSLLYNYVGENIKELRVRGIRGSIEMTGLKDGDPVLEPISKILKITQSELLYIRDKLLNDYQVKLISTLWDEFKPQSSSAIPLPTVPQPAPTNGDGVKPVVGPDKVEAVKSLAEPAKTNGDNSAATNVEAVKPVGESTNGESSKETEKPENTL